MQTAHPRSNSLRDAEDPEFDRAFDASFGIVAFIANRHLIHHMLRATREMRLDFESMILLGVLAHQNVLHLVGRERSGSAASPSARTLSASGDFRPVRIRDLNQITSIPRETIRRKLNLMEQRGLVARHADGGWVMNPDAIQPETRASTRETVRQLLQCADEIRTVMGESLRAPGAGPASVPTQSR